MLKKKVEVIILPTNQKNNFYINDKKELCYSKHKVFLGINSYFVHLYFVDDSPIKEGDWKYNPKLSCVWQHKREGKHSTSDTHPDTKKVIATTDKSLEPNKNWTNLENPSDIYLPQPSDSFIAKYIEMYNAGNPIKYVMVEYEEKMGDEGIIALAFKEDEYKVKVDKNNTITITRCKESWSREEIIEFGLKCVNLGMDLNNNPSPRLNGLSGKDYYYKWIEQNL